MAADSDSALGFLGKMDSTFGEKNNSGCFSVPSASKSTRVVDFLQKMEAIEDKINAALDSRGAFDLLENMEILDEKNNSGWLEGKNEEEGETEAMSVVDFLLRDSRYGIPVGVQGSTTTVEQSARNLGKNGEDEGGSCTLAEKKENLKLMEDEQNPGGEVTQISVLPVIDGHRAMAAVEQRFHKLGKNDGCDGFEDTFVKLAEIGKKSREVPQNPVLTIKSLNYVDQSLLDLEKDNRSEDVFAESSENHNIPDAEAAKLLFLPSIVSNNAKKSPELGVHDLGKIDEAGGYQDGFAKFSDNVKNQGGDVAKIPFLPVVENPDTKDGVEQGIYDTEKNDGADFSVSSNVEEIPGGEATQVHVMPVVECHDSVHELGKDGSEGGLATVTENVETPGGEVAQHPSLPLVGSLDSMAGVEQSVYKLRQDNGSEDAFAKLLENGKLSGEIAAQMPVLPVVETHGSMADIEVNVHNSGLKKDKFSFAENGEIPDKRVCVTQIPISVPEDEKEKVSDKINHFSVGDFVWGKVRSYPYCPGRIYDPSDAPEDAAKCKQKDCFLVGYFGDNSFSWCNPSQLEPFKENFEAMWKQSNSSNFTNAVEAVLDEVSRLVELEMTCSCISKRNQLKSSSSNSGIKEGAFVPKCRTGKLSIAQYEPALLVEKLGEMAQNVSSNDLLELNLLKSWLSAFYHARGGYQLPIFHEPHPIPDPEGSNISAFMEGPSKAPEEGLRISLLTDPRCGPTDQSSVQQDSTISEDKMYERRKQKNIAEILEEAVDLESKYNWRQAGKFSSAFTNEKLEDGCELESHMGSKLTSPLGKKRGKKPKLPESSITAENKGAYVENCGSKGPMKRGRKRSSSVECHGDNAGETNKNNMSNSKNDDGLAKEENNHSRERKKSKYLSPPYASTTRIKFSKAHLVSKRDKKEDSVKAFNVDQNQMEEQIKASCGHEPVEDKYEVIDVKDTMVSSRKVLSKLQEAAISPQKTKGSGFLGKVKRFVSIFRNSLFRDGFNYQVYNRRRRAKKRKSMLEPSSVGGNPTRAIYFQQQSRVGKKKAARLDVSKLKRALVASDEKTDKSTDGIASSPALFLWFPPAADLPTKDDVIAIYKRFGALNETETGILEDPFCARVVFARAVDAEQAFNESTKSSPLGAAKVTFSLQYPSSSCLSVQEVTENLQTRVPSTDKEGSRALEISTIGTESPSASQLDFIKQKLGMMTSMIESSDGDFSQDMKSNFECEMKGLLEKVSAMSTPSST